MKEIEGLQNAARFAIQPNMWGFCGEDMSQEILRDFVSERKIDRVLVRETLSSHGFPHLNAFLEAISAISKRDIFDDELVLSYWMGNDLTEKIGLENKKNLILRYEQQISEDFAQQLEKNLPENIYLTHLSQVALIAAEGYLQTEKTKLINQCMVAYGKIVSLDLKNKTAVVERDILRKNETAGYRVVLGKQSVKIDPDLTPELSIDDDITVHLGYLAAKLTKEESVSLKFWTRKVAGVV